MEKTYNDLIWETFQKLLNYLKTEKPEIEQKIREEVKDIWYLLTGIQNYLMPYFTMRTIGDPVGTLMVVCELDEEGLKKMAKENFGLKDEDFLKITRPQKNKISGFLKFMCKAYHSIPKQQ